MDKNGQWNNSPHDDNPADIFHSPRNIVAIYTVLSILIQMKRVLGLEAMLEYVEEYMRIAEKHTPEMKPAVTEALTLMSVEKIYREAMRGPRE